jgi:hypothetical protein
MYKLHNIDQLHLNVTTALNSAIIDSPSESKASEEKQEATEKNAEYSGTTCANSQSKIELLLS